MPVVGNHLDETSLRRVLVVRQLPRQRSAYSRPGKRVRLRIA
jgi:hypothetical protein